MTAHKLVRLHDHIRIFATMIALTRASPKARDEGRYKGRPEDTERNASIADMLERGMSWSKIQDATGCSRSTILKISKRAAAEA